jgi:putative effector of murein hydrolase LrgA (UPF0299 family)
MFGILLFSPSIISIFDRGGLVTFFGVPLLVQYLFGAWLFLIIAAGVMVYRRRLSMLPVIEDEED